MKIDSTEYENLVAEISNGIMDRASNIINFELRSGKSCHVNGASGHEHQIDIEIKINKKLYLIECKCWDKKVPVDQMLVFFGRVRDIRNSVAEEVIPIFVTAKGCQPGAELIAKKYNIDMHVVKNANEFALGIAGNLTIGLQGLEAKGQVGEIKVIIKDNA